MKLDGGLHNKTVFEAAERVQTGAKARGFGVRDVGEGQAQNMDMDEGETREALDAWGTMERVIIRASVRPPPACTSPAGTVLCTFEHHSAQRSWSR